MHVSNPWIRDREEWYFGQGRQLYPLEFVQTFIQRISAFSAASANGDLLWKTEMPSAIGFVLFYQSSEDSISTTLVHLASSEKCLPVMREVSGELHKPFSLAWTERTSHSCEPCFAYLTYLHTPNTSKHPGVYFKIHRWYVWQNRPLWIRIPWMGFLLLLEAVKNVVDLALLPVKSKAKSTHAPCKLC